MMDPPTGPHSKPVMDPRERPALRDPCDEGSSTRALIPPSAPTTRPFHPRVSPRRPCNLHCAAILCATTRRSLDPEGLRESSPDMPYIIGSAQLCSLKNLRVSARAPLRKLLITPGSRITRP
ncbi:hypothetical protein SKAU_G00085710 [Synaphobranchus kaupii]|uniref:Uncharacterized protein n=1 Tax=Synaphobranchus kaupii TaxID=118154 RepID=A0A9Q1FVJ3_SYNKA|nr:hypothetical protein SKAU_G00085710 [Synaphobranchus kaupii]